MTTSDYKSGAIDDALPLSAETIFRVTSVEEASPVAAPEMVASFRVLTTLGEGGSGIVYCAQQDAPRRHVALKVLKRVGPQSVRRFKREAEALGKLQHRGIAQIYSAGEVDSPAGSVPYIAMELIDGLPITRFASKGELSLRDKLRLMLQVCDALTYAHERGIVHRDLKPSNILVTRDGEPKVLDFGLSFETAADASMTNVTGQIVGTLAYMSPEQVQGVSLDERTDVYSLGIVAYELLTGRRPYEVQADAPLVAAKQIVDSNPPSLGSIDRVFRGDLDTILGRAMEKDPARRYPTVTEFAEDIRRYLSDSPIRARRPTLRYRAAKFVRRHKRLVMATVAVILALTIGLIATANEAIRARQAEQRASASERDAKRSLAEAYMSSGRAWLAAKGMTEARNSYLAAWDIYESLGESTFAAEISVWDVDRQQPRPIAKWRAHSGLVRAVAVSERAAMAVSVGDDKKIRVWNLKTLQEVSQIERKESVFKVAISPDGSKIAITDFANHVALYDSATRRLIGEWKAGSLPSALAFDLDGRRLVWAAERQIMAVDLSALGEPQVQFTSGSGGVSFVMAGKYCACYDSTGMISILEGTKVVRSWKHNNVVGAAALVQSDEILAISSSDGMTLYRVSDGQAVKTLPVAKQSSICSVSAEESLMAMYVGNAVTVWDVKTGVEKWKLAPWGNDTTSLGCSGTSMILGNADGMIAFVNASTEIEFSKISTGTDELFAVAICRDGHVVSSDAGGNIGFWDSKTKRRLFEKKVPVAAEAVTGTDADGFLYVGSTDGIIWQWKPSENAPLQMADLGTPIFALSLSSNGQTLAAATGNSEAPITFWSLDEKMAEWSPKAFQSAICAFAWKNSDQLVAATEDGGIWEFSIKDRSVRCLHKLVLGARKIACLTGDRLAIALSSGKILICQMDKAPLEIATCRSTPTALITARDGCYLLCIETSGATRVIDAATGKAVSAIELNFPTDAFAGISDDGGTLVLAGYDKCIAFGDISIPAQERILSRQYGAFDESRNDISGDHYFKMLELRHPVMIKR